MRLPPPLLAITPGTLQRAPGGSFESLIVSMERAVAAAIEGGVTGLLVREPNLEDGAFLELCQRLIARLDRGVADGAIHGRWFGIHDRLHLAAVVECDGVHVGSCSLPVGVARGVVGEIALGASSHRGDDPGSLVPADYLLHAPTFDPSSKPSYGAEPLGWDGVSAMGAAAPMPVWALGGITAERLEPLLAPLPEPLPEPLPGGAAPGLGAGIAGVAMIGGLWGTGPEPVDGAGFLTGRPLQDVGAIVVRARRLVELVHALLPKEVSP